MTETTRMTFGDMFRNSFLNMFPETIDPWSLVTVLAVSLLLGLGIFLVYRHCFIGVVYDHSFNISLVVMTILTAVIIVTISSNVMLSLGMVGALSIVRYRTAVKSPMDLMFLFWAITTGIAVGATYYYIAALAFLFVAVTFAALRQLQSSDQLRPGYPRRRGGPPPAGQAQEQCALQDHPGGQRRADHRGHPEKRQCQPCRQRLLGEGGPGCDAGAVPRQL